jgi:2-hydroxy-3-keto-5-methylthiopentenyl-1-phosphate phosphatase
VATLQSAREKGLIDVWESSLWLLEIFRSTTFLSTMLSVPFYGTVNAVLRDNTTHKLTLLKKLLSSRRSKLIVVSDFDHTLTKFTSAQCHDIVGYNKQYSGEFIKEFKEIFYKPMASLSEWWRVAHDLLVAKSGLTKDMLKDRLNEEVIAVRDGLPDFAVNLRLKHVPLIIVSAGIKDVIAHAMASCNIPIAGDHLFHIDANFLDFHESGQLANIYPEDPVHSQSKQLVHQRAAHMFSFLNREGNQLESDVTVGSVSAAPVEEIGIMVMEEMRQSAISDAKSPDRIDSAFLDSPHKKSALAATAPASPGAGPAVDAVVAVVMGDRPHDFFVMDAFPEVHTFRIGFARHGRSDDVQGLLQEGECDVVLVGEEHSLEAVHLLVDELIQARDSGSAGEGIEEDVTVVRGTALNTEMKL